MTAHAALAAHMRLASLPRWGRVTAPVDEAAKRQEAAEKARRTMKNSGTVTRGRAPVVLPSKTPNLPPTPKPRKRRETFVILAPKPNRWGFKRGDELEATGGKLRGQRGVYQGVASSTRVIVVVDGVKRQVLADHWQRVAG